MTDRKQQRKQDKKVKIEKLEVSKETVQDLTNTQAERVGGGLAAADSGNNCCDRSRKTTFDYGC